MPKDPVTTLVIPTVPLVAVVLIVKFEAEKLVMPLKVARVQL